MSLNLASHERRFFLCFSYDRRRWDARSCHFLQYDCFSWSNYRRVNPEGRNLLTIWKCTSPPKTSSPLASPMITPVNWRFSPQIARSETEERWWIPIDVYRLDKAPFKHNSTSCCYAQITTLIIDLNKDHFDRWSQSSEISLHKFNYHPALLDGATSGNWTEREQLIGTIVDWKCSCERTGDDNW